MLILLINLIHLLVNNQFGYQVNITENILIKMSIEDRINNLENKINILSNDFNLINNNYKKINKQLEKFNDMEKSTN